MIDCYNKLLVLARHLDWYVRFVNINCLSLQQIPQEEVNALQKLGMPEVHTINKDYDKFSYPPRSLSENQTTRVSRFFKYLSICFRFMIL